MIKLPKLSENPLLTGVTLWITSDGWKDSKTCPSVHKSKELFKNALRRESDRIGQNKPG